MQDNKSAVVRNLLRLAPHTTVIHHIPGRIRFRVLPSGEWIAREMDLEALHRDVPGIRKVRVNAMAGSVVIEYDPKRLAPDLWEELSRLRKNPELAPEVEERLNSVVG